jgi:hypothetical protein
MMSLQSVLLRMHTRVFRKAECLSSAAAAAVSCGYRGDGSWWPFNCSRFEETGGDSSCSRKQL